jgi:aryl-alcohol dehydrogenase-like predicted oxidoreductase
MQYRRLGKTGFRVSEIGFGAWGIGKSFWVGARDHESIAALHAAVDAGVNFIDTALVYGQGVTVSRSSGRWFAHGRSGSTSRRKCRL